jgi:hypothetical protein
VSVPLGLRLAVAGGRDGATRIAVMTVGVAVGVVLLLLALTALPALRGREVRDAWHETSPQTAATAGSDGVLWLPANDHYRGRPLFRVRVAALGPRPVVPPELETLPGAGEVAVSPALRKLLATAAPDELGGRFPGTVTATIGDAGLASPDELVAVIGDEPTGLRALGASEVHGLAGPGPTRLTGFLGLLLVIAGLGLLVPVVVFVAMATRIAAARREQRFAALRLTGATGGQIGWMAATESALAAFSGVLVGWCAYLASRPVVAHRITFDGAHFVAADVAVPAGQLVLVLLGVPVLVIASTLAVLHRVRLSPLGVTRAVRRRPPGAWRVAVPLLGLIGFALLAVLRGTSAIAANGRPVLLLAGISLLLTLLGIVVAGAWACMLAARLLARLSRHAPPLLAARRMAADPSTTFRAIAGVVLAAFVTSMFAGVARDPAAKSLEGAQLRPNIVEVLTAGQPADRVSLLVDRLSSSRRLLIVHSGTRPGTLAVSCAELATVVNLACSASPPSFAGLPPPGLTGLTGLTPPRTDGPVHAIYAETSGPAAEDEIRTVVAGTLPGAVTSTRTDQVELDTRQLRELDQGLRLALLFVLVVAACSLTVAAIAGLTERRRPFALLRASGVRVSELRTTVLLETAVPLAVTLLAGAGIGLAVGAAITTAGGQHWRPPGGDFLTGLGFELLIAVAVTALPLPLINRLTHHDAVRFD